MVEERKKPYTGRELFDIVTKQLEAEGKMPEIIEYVCPREDKGEPCELRTEEFDVTATLMYGSNEGAFIDVNIRDRERNITIGVVKTCNSGDDAVRALGCLAADYMITAGKFVEDHMQEFDWTGYTIFEDGSPVLTLRGEKAEKRAFERAKTMTGNVRIRDNETRKWVEEETTKKHYAPYLRYGQILVTTKLGAEALGTEGIIIPTNYIHVDDKLYDMINHCPNHYVAKHCDKERELTHIAEAGIVNRYGFFLTEKKVEFPNGSIDVENGWFTVRSCHCTQGAQQGIRDTVASMM